LVYDSFEAFFIALLTSSTVTSFSNTTVTSVNEPVATGTPYGSLFDATQTRVMSVGDRQLVKVAAWYDNEMSYTLSSIE
jgi:glyceraldehyde 3-phosphate dehydrogenase